MTSRSSEFRRLTNCGTHWAGGVWDLVLADYSLPHFSAIDSLAILKETGLDIPLIVVSGSIGEETAVHTMKAGAADYVMKDRLSRLGPVIRRELHEADERYHKREAERSLAESEEHYRLLVENQTDLIIKTTVDGRFLYASPTYCTLFGKELHELTGKTFSPPVYPDDTAIVKEAVAALVQPPYTCRYELRMMTVNGWRWIDWNCRAELNGDGAVTAFISSGRDSTERKQMEERLRISEEDLRQAQAIAHVGSWRWDIVHDKLSGSDEMYRIFGISRQEPSGLTWDTILQAIYPDDRPLVEEIRKLSMENHKLQRSMECRTIWPDGSVHFTWAEAGELILDDHDNVLSLTGVVLDVTEKKAADLEKEALHAQLAQSQKMEAIGELASGIAHDFNNLLTGILGNVTIMRSLVDPADPLREYLNATELSARHAADLTGGLLTFGRNAVVMPVPLDPNAAIEASLTIVQQSLPATVDIVRDFESVPWHVLMDQSQVTQIMLNLAVNARDAMNNKGTLAIRTRNVTIDETYVHSHAYARTGSFVHLTVSDTGPGIPPAIMQHLFEPFHTTKPAGSGTGLGLSVVYGAVKQAGGWITVDSAPGEGTTFDIFLPRCLAEPHVSKMPEATTPGVCTGTILVVEDEPVVCAVAQTLLARSGCAVLTARDGAAAVAAMQTCPGTIDLVLLDMTMPGMTTREIIPLLRALTPSVSILLTSGYTSGDEVTRLMESGSVQGFLAKPYDLQHLLTAISSALHHT